MKFLKRWWWILIVMLLLLTNFLWIGWTLKKMNSTLLPREINYSTGKEAPYLFNFSEEIAVKMINDRTEYVLNDDNGVQIKVQSMVDQNYKLIPIRPGGNSSAFAGVKIDPVGQNLSEEWKIEFDFTNSKFKDLLRDVRQVKVFQLFGATVRSLPITVDQTVKVNINKSGIYVVTFK